MNGDWGGVEGLIQRLTGCEWGRGVSRADDTEACPERAVGIVVLHDGDVERAFKLCERHRAIVLEESTPRGPQPATD